MDYKEALLDQIQRYYDEIVKPYKTTTTDAMTDARKMSVFKKKDFAKHIAGFKSHMADAEVLRINKVQVPEEDEQTYELAEVFYKSLLSFDLLCQVSIDFYHVCERRQQRGSGFKIKEYTAALQKMQRILAVAVAELDTLDKKYQEYTADDTPNQD